MAKVLKKVSSRTETESHRTAICHECGSGWGITSGHVNHDKHLALIGTKHDCGNIIEDSIQTYVNRIPGYTLVLCNCGEKIECSGFTTTCDCGRDYNWNGTLLAPRSQWGEETGEDF